jgi:hypothetical protein
MQGRKMGSFNLLLFSFEVVVDPSGLTQRREDAEAREKRKGRKTKFFLNRRWEDCRGWINAAKRQTGDHAKRFGAICFKRDFGGGIACF